MILGKKALCWNYHLRPVLSLFLCNHRNIMCTELEESGTVLGCWNRVVFVFSVLRMKSSLAERSWALCSSSTGPLPDDDSKHGWVLFESRLPYSTYVQKLARVQGNTQTCTPLTHPPAGTAWRKITHVRERKSVRRLLTAPDGSFCTHLFWSFFTLLLIKMLFSWFLCFVQLWTLDFAHRKALSARTSPSKIQSIRDSSFAHLFIFTPTRPANTHMHSYLYAKPLTHTHTHSGFLHTIQLKQWSPSCVIFACAQDL